MIKLKRVYDKYSSEDGFRILVDRLWPRGVSKEKAHIDLWLKEIAPSDELRKWFSHDPERWEEFAKRYFRELKDHSDVVRGLKDILRKNKTVTFVYSAKDKERNNAITLNEFLRRAQNS